MNKIIMVVLVLWFAAYSGLAIAWERTAQSEFNRGFQEAEEFQNAFIRNFAYGELSRLDINNPAAVRRFLQKYPQVGPALLAERLRTEQHFDQRARQREERERQRQEWARRDAERKRQEAEMRRRQEKLDELRRQEEEMQAKILRRQKEFEDGVRDFQKNNE